MKKNYTISIPRSRFWTVLVPLAVLCMVIGGLLGVFLVDRFVMPRIVGVSSRGVVAVPQIAGVPMEEAREQLYRCGLRLDVAQKEYSKSIASLSIISQEPAAGTEVKNGRHVSVVISLGPEVASVPNVEKLTERQARKSLKDAGFEIVSVVKAYDEETPADQAVGTEPPAGTKTSREVTVQIKMSKGSKPTSVIVPNVIGEMLSDARAKIEDSGLKTGRVDFRNASTSPSGTIVSQSLAPGATVPLESAVDLVVAAGR
jgi:eukaryotic-like serine/threonine-protein kinase